MPSKAALLVHFLLPSKVELLAYIIISTVFLMLCNLWAFIGVLTGDTSLSSIQVSSALTTYKEQFDALFSAPFFAAASTFIVWAIIGCVAYMVAYVIKSYLGRMYEEKHASGNVQPRYIQSNQGYWKSAASHNIFFFCTILVTIVFLVVTLGTFAPGCITLFNDGLASWFSWQSIAAFAGSIVGLVVLIQITRILFRLIHNSWKIYFATEE